jgi:hypothetical protein
MWQSRQTPADETVSMADTPPSNDSAARVVRFPGGSGRDREEANPPPPDNIPATEAMLGNLLIHRTPDEQAAQYERISAIIEPDDIHIDLLRRIYVAIGQCVDAGRLANPITLQSVFPPDEFARPGETVHQYLGCLGAHQAVTSADAIEFAHAVHDCALRRQLIYITETVRDAGYKNSFPIQEQLQELSTRVESLVTARHGQGLVTPTPYMCPNEATLPRRPFIYGAHEERGNVNALLGQPGAAKTTLMITEMLAKCTGRQLLHDAPVAALRCWLWTGEEKRHEIDLRMAAAVRHHGINPAELSGRLFVDTGRERKLVIASAGRDGTIIHRPMTRALVRALRDRQIDSFIIDPLIKSHRVPENDNVAMDEILSEWADVADQANCTVTLVAHPRKTGGAQVSAEDMRGGSSQIGAVRAARVLNKMKAEEAEKLSLEEPWRHVRIDDAKANNAPPGKARWVRLESVQLINGEKVGVAAKWDWPDPFKGVSVADLRAVQKAIEAGRWRENAQAKDWVGNVVANVLGLDLQKKADKAKIAAMLKTWITNGALTVVTGHDEKRRPKSFVEVGKVAD